MFITPADQEKSQKRLKRTGLDYLHYQPRPAHIHATGDCVIRALTWFFPEESYDDIHKELQARSNARFGPGKNILLSGCAVPVIAQFMRQRGWIYKEAKATITMRTIKRSTYSFTVPREKRQLFKGENLPRTCVAITTDHCVAIEDGIVLDAWDSRGDRSAYLEGYFVKA